MQADGQDRSPLHGRAVVAPRIETLLAPAETANRAPRAAASVRVDGQADEWADVPAMVLDQPDQARRSWDGPDDPPQCT